VNSLAGTLAFRVADNLKNTRATYLYPAFPVSTPALFTRAVISIDKNRRNDIDVQYTFTFTIENDIPTGSTLILTAPTNYNFITTSPAIRISYPDFVNAR
jgi:hypothetical protein